MGETDMKLDLKKFLGKKDTDMTQGNIIKQLLSFAVPMLIGLLFQVLYNTVDTMVVGKFVSKQALAAVGCNSSIINTIVGVFSGLATGASVVISQAYGAKDAERLSRAVHTTCLLTLYLCVVGTAAGLLAARPLLKITNTAEDVMEDAMTYLLIYFAGLTGVLVYNMGSGILRAVGDSTSPVIFLIVSALTNIVLDLAFVLLFHMGVAGVAWATVISQLLSSVLVVNTLMKADVSYRLYPKKLKIHGDVLKDTMRLGLPSAIQSGVTAFSNVFVQAYINSFGSDGMAGWSAYNKLDSFLTVPVMAIAMASTTFVGQCWGAKMKERARKGSNQALLMSFAVTVVFAIVYVVLARPLVLMFANAEDAEVVEYGTYFIRWITPFYPLICFNQIYSGSLRGIGNAIAPTVIMLSSFVVFRQIYLFVFSKLLGGGQLVITLAYPIGWVLCSVLISICYFRSKLYRDEGTLA